MRSKMQNLAKAYPKLMKMEDSDSKFGLPHYVDCGVST